MKAVKITVCAVAALVCIAALGGEWLLSAPAEAANPLDQTACWCDTAPDEAFTPVQSPTTGRWYYAMGEYKPLAVMIENSPDARPQCGLQAADIVYECNAEGNITRFMCLFNDNICTYVGPIRSARVYFMRLQQEWDAAYVHFGGPTNRSYVDDLVDIYGSNCYHIDVRMNLIGGHAGLWWREKAPRYAPHNVFTDLTLLQAIIPEESDPRTPLKFSSESVYSDNGKQVDSVTIEWLLGTYVTYKYDADIDKLIRYSGRGSSAEAHYDGNTGKPIEVQNLIIMHCAYSLHWNGVNRMVTLTGSGRCDYIIGGQHITGTWVRKSYTDDTLYLDSEGNEIVLVAGNTWVAVQPAGKSLSVVYSDTQN